jgi:hypothetical protein
MGIKMVEYVAYLIYFHLPSEKRTSIIQEMIMELDFSDPRKFTRGAKKKCSPKMIGYGVSK